MLAFRHVWRLVLRAAVFVCTVSFLPAQSDQLIEQSRRGKELMAQGRFEEAASIYREMVKAMPGNAGLLLNLALAEEMAGHPEQAVPRFEQVLKQAPENIPALTSLGMARLQMNQPQRAIAPLKKVVLLNPKDANARGMLAGAEMGVGHVEEAASQYRNLTALAPEDPKAWYGLGKAYETLAGKRFSQLTKLDSQSPYVAFLLAESRMARAQYRSAFFFYKEAEKKSPTLPGVHDGIARVYRETGHSDWAASEEKREGGQTLPDCKLHSQACNFMRGKWLEASRIGAGQPSAESLFWSARAFTQLAVQAFGELGKLPESPEQHEVKAQIARDHGQHMEAAKEWRAALAVAPGQDQFRLQIELATALFMAHDYQSVLPMLQSLLRTDPNSADLNFMVGESLWRTQKADDALPYLQRALTRNPNLLPAEAALGLALVSLNRNDEALPHLEKAVNLDDDGSLHYSLARAYQSVGDKDRAQRSMETYRMIQRRNAEVNGELAKEAEITGPLSQAPRQ